MGGGVVARNDLSFDRVNDVIAYDPLTGSLHWLASGSGRSAPGLRAGGPNQNGYWHVKIGGRTYASHRIAWLLSTGSWPTGYIDHINGDRSDNRIANLRDVDWRTNSENKRKVTGLDTTTGLMGVHIDKRWPNVFRAKLKARGVVHQLGSFESPEAAHAAYIEAKRRLHAGCTL